MKYKKFSDIPKLIEDGNYRCDISWDFLLDWMKKHPQVNMDPDFQRAHVWDTERQAAYVEAILKNSNAPKEIRWNAPEWAKGNYKEIVIVDGKQRLHAVMLFLQNKLPIFDNQYFKDFEGRLPWSCSFVFKVNELNTKAKVLQWYLDLNLGGVAHTTEEIEKVKTMLKSI